MIGSAKCSCIVWLEDPHDGPVEHFPRVEQDLYARDYPQQRIWWAAQDVFKVGGESSRWYVSVKKETPS